MQKTDKNSLKMA